MRTSNIVVNDPRYGPRRSRHGRGRYHSCRLVRDRRGLHNLLLRPPAQPPIGAHIVPFFRQKKLCGSTNVRQRRKDTATRRSTI
jgi:hypothetical protein